MPCADDGRELTVPVLLDGEESIMEFIDLPYSGVCTLCFNFKRLPSVLY